MAERNFIILKTIKYNKNQCYLKVNPTEHFVYFDKNNYMWMNKDCLRGGL